MIQRDPSNVQRSTRVNIIREIIINIPFRYLKKKNNKKADFLTKGHNFTSQSTEIKNILTIDLITNDGQILLAFIHLQLLNKFDF